MFASWFDVHLSHLASASASLPLCIPQVRSPPKAQTEPRVYPVVCAPPDQQKATRQTKTSPGPYQDKTRRQNPVPSLVRRCSRDILATQLAHCLRDLPALHPHATYTTYTTYYLGKETSGALDTRL
ncbi:hypothetical protein F5Y14DRAFT_128329 [Nemania sp. NC0429]|nr:hypothetical protein F5Y14DRAFT_128329 [Nemania sp. NC0429]